MVNKRTGLIILWVLSLQSTLSDDSTFPKKSLLIMKALFEVESNSKGITFFPLKLSFFFFFFLMTLFGRAGSSVVAWAFL